MKRVLIVDDDEFILLGLTRAIAGTGYSLDVCTARHGKQAIEILESAAVDVIVTDLKMPVMNGYEVVDYVNRNFPSIPVYVMTGDYLPDVVSRFRPAAVLQFVSKPFSFRQVAGDICLTVACPPASSLTA